MNTMRKRTWVALLLATAVAGTLVGGGIGYTLAPSVPAAGSSTSSALDEAPADTEVLAVSDSSGDLVELSAEEQATFEQNSTPIDADEVTFAENADLTADEVRARQDEMATKYAVGDPLEAEDLEFLRAYLLVDAESDSPTVKAVSYGTQGGNNGADTEVESAINIQPVMSSKTAINRKKTKLGTGVSQVGSITLKISEPDLVTNSWSTSFTAKRTSGKSLTKIKTKVNVQGYGATASWPFVGKVYGTSQSSTSPANKQSWSFNRSATFKGAIVQLDVQTYAYFWNSSGSFQLP